MRDKTRISRKEYDRIFLNNMWILLGFSLLIGPRSHHGVSEPQQPHTVLQSDQNLSETNDGKPTILQGEQK